METSDERSDLVLVAISAMSAGPMLGCASLRRPVFLHSGATDMRKSFDGLARLIRGSFCVDAADGSLFLFADKRCDWLKALGRNGYGFVLLQKPLEWGALRSCRHKAAQSACGSTETNLL